MFSSFGFFFPLHIFSPFKMARSLGVFLLFFFVVTCGVSQDTTISSVESFLEFVSKANESTGPFGGTVFLGVDIGLGGKPFSPIGLRDDGGCNAFTGMFFGSNKVIRGAKVENTRDAGLFCRLEGATVANLHLDSSCNFTGRRVGAISASASNVNLWNVSSEATIVGVTKKNDNHAKNVIDPSSEFDKDKIKIDIEDELKDMGYVVGDVTVREDDGKLVVSVIVADQDSYSVVESLRGCISSSSM